VTYQSGEPSPVRAGILLTLEIFAGSRLVAQREDARLVVYTFLSRIGNIADRCFQSRCDEGIQKETKATKEYKTGPTSQVSPALAFLLLSLSARLVPVHFQIRLRTLRNSTSDPPTRRASRCVQTNSSADQTIPNCQRTETNHMCCMSSSSLKSPQRTS
jgi:hypothetical protein